MNRRPGSLLLILFALSGALGFAQTSRDTTVEVSATVQVLPPQIALNWLPTSFPTTLQKVYRKSNGATTWTDLATLSNSATTFVDTAVAVGVSYEYFVVRLFSSTDPGTASGYVNGGIRLPLRTFRGRALLLVDDSMAAALAAELDVYISDLVGDGWIVARQDVPRNGTAIATKAIIQTLYNSDPTQTRSLILFGHVPVPYSGNLNPDGHPEHRGAWPSDSYYADMDGVWTDTTVNTVSAGRVENRNIPGDGKFDQSGIPSDLELEVGRIDLANLPSASPTPSEIDLLRQYLNRDHAFRVRTGNYASIPRRGLIADNFGYFGGEAFAASGWRNFTACFGSTTGATVEQPWFPTLENDAYLLAYGCGGGSYVSAGGIGGTGDFANRRCLSVFNLIFGSYFGDWDVADSFLRAPLAGRADSLGLVSVWAGRPHWHLYHMALGETVGYAARTTQNNAGFAAGGYTSGHAGRGVHIALMGDPTLRLHPVRPPSNLVIDSSSGNPTLSWTASSDSNVEGYIVLRSSAATGPFDSVGGSLIVGTNFVDRSGTPGLSYHYQVRTVRLEASASGTYLNGSQGVFGMGSFLSPVVREIQVTGTGRAIPNGDSSGTDFGAAEATVQSVTRTFTIANDGTASLTLPGTPAVQISGSSAFTVVNSQPTSPIAASGSVAFQIRFFPATAGLHTATVGIANDDPDESAYQFSISGQGLPPAPEINVLPASISTTLAPSSTMTTPVTIGNTGAGALHHAVTTSQSGYSFRDSNFFGGPGYAWIDIRATGTEVTGFSDLDDGLSGAIPIGFGFPFFGNSFNSLRVCTNGFISFGSAAPLFYGPNLPSLEASGNVIAAFWTDLILNATGHIYTEQIGDLFVIQFENIARFGVESEQVTCQIVLHQTGEIFIQYQQVPAGFTDYSAGIQDGQRSQGLSVAYHTNYAQAQLAVRIVPPVHDSWLGSSIPSGTIAAGGSQRLSATLNSTGLSPGRYFASLQVDSDDADEARVLVPLELTVFGPEIETLGNGLVIPSGYVTTAVVDGTEFGMAAIAGGTVSHTFTIRNPGSDPLTLSPVSVTGSGFSISTQPSASVPPAGISTFVVTFAPTVAGAATGTVTFTTNDADEATYTFTVTGLALTPIESWRLTYFGAIANTGNGADLADADADGLSNLAEYGLSLDPKLPANGAIPTTRVNGGGYLEIEFTRNTGRTDLTYTVQVSSDLVTWTPIARSASGGTTVGSGAHSVAETGTGAIKTVSVEDSQTAVSGSPRFLRVTMVRN